ncbi:transcript variant X2 [Nothobranchius furzeri]|uniref:Transcript variant X2 n=1 Tax=Nothobranchius furzeri TaxID=105023 RepID=A0A9D2Y6V6_NOTFU|nr:transcription cofactor vestigial-like protein 3 isoform X2 [Nothobranchius furzeri]KAF7215075.1 transcript variant X2 [Nothobranchius furzeri]
MQTGGHGHCARLGIYGARAGSEDTARLKSQGELTFSPRTSSSSSSFSTLIRSIAMSCLEVMYHQSYGAHHLPAAAYKATYYSQQQQRLSAYSKMQESMEQQQQQQGAGRGMPARGHQGPQPGSAGAESSIELKDTSQPAEAEYLSSRCVLFTYFKGDIGDVVDEHFSRALSQSSTFSGDTKPVRVTQPSASNTANLWKGGGSLPEGQGTSPWSSSFPSQANSCLPSVPISVHPDFSSSPVPFSHPEGALWAGHMLSQASIPSAATLPDTWTYSLSPQSPSGYPHEVYHPHSRPHPHIHTRHHHSMLHPYPTHSPALDPRFNALLLPGVRSQTSSSAGSSPHSDGAKTEMDLSPVTAAPVTWTPPTLHGPLEVYDSAMDQTKAKTPVWF